MIHRHSRDTETTLRMGIVKFQKHCLQLTVISLIIWSRIKLSTITSQYPSIKTLKCQLTFRLLLIRRQSPKLKLQFPNLQHQLIQVLCPKMLNRLKLILALLLHSTIERRKLKVPMLLQLSTSTTWLSNWLKKNELGNVLQAGQKHMKPENNPNSRSTTPKSECMHLTLTQTKTARIKSLADRQLQRFINKE